MSKRTIAALSTAALTLGTLSSTAMAAEADHEPITITMFSMPANTSGTLTDTWWTDYIADELGITIELLPSGDSDEMKIQTLMAADELPDIVVFEGTSYLKNAIDAGMLVCLDDYAEQMPNAQKYIKESMQYYADNVASDGKCYAISNNIGPRTKGGMLNWTIALRWDLYQEIGAPKIDTAWDYLDVLRQMQDIHPENEYGQKVYAITSWNDWDAYTMSNATEYSLTKGIDSGDQLGTKVPLMCVDLATKEISPALDAESAYVEGLKFYFTANQMGILDPDSMTQTWNTAVEKASSGRNLFSWWDWAVGSYNTPERVNADEPYGFNVILPAEAKLPVFGTDPIGSGWCFAISRKSKHIDRCIEYLDFMCNPEKMFVLANGPQGETWDINEEGVPYLTEKGIAISKDGSIQLDGGGTVDNGFNVINSYPLSTGNICEAYGTTIANSDWPTTERVISKLEQQRIDATGFDRPVDQILADEDHITMPLAGSLVAPLSNDMQILATQIGDVVKTQSWLAVYAADEEEFNRIIDEMIKSAYDLGYAELIEYNEQAWKDACKLAEKYETSSEQR